MAIKTVKSHISVRSDHRSQSFAYDWPPLPTPPQLHIDRCMRHWALVFNNMAAA